MLGTTLPDRPTVIIVGGMNDCGRKDERESLLSRCRWWPGAEGRGDWSPLVCVDPGTRNRVRAECEDCITYKRYLFT